MSEKEYINEILKTNIAIGNQGFTPERLREISICLSSLNNSIELPIIEILVKQEELKKKSNEYKTLVINCILDCFRLALPLPCSYLKKTKKRNFSKIRSARKKYELIDIQTTSTNIIFGLEEHIDIILDYIMEPNGNYSRMTPYIYSLERVSENGSKLLIYLFDNICKKTRNEKIIDIFNKSLNLAEKSVICSKKQITEICREIIVGILKYSGILNIRYNLVLTIFIKLCTVFIEYTRSQISKNEFMEFVASVFSKVGTSGISHYTNVIITESTRYLIYSQFKKYKFNSVDDDYWWRDETLLIPKLIKELILFKKKEIKIAIIEIACFLNNLDIEFVQVLITQFICDLKENNDQFRLETVKMVSSFILFNYTLGINLTNLENLNNFSNKESRTNFNNLYEQLFECWLSKTNDKQNEIRVNVLSNIIEILDYLNKKNKLEREFETFIKFLINYGQLPFPKMREDLIKIITNWINNPHRKKNASLNKLFDDSINYLLGHIYDKNRNIRIFLIKNLKNYKKDIKTFRNLWMLWYISLKENDFFMRNIIEEILIEFNPYEIFLEYSDLISKRNINEIDSVDHFKVSDSVLYKIVKMFYNKRFILLRNFRLFIVSIYCNCMFNNNILEKYISILKKELSSHLSHIFSNDEISIMDSSDRIEKMLDEIKQIIAKSENFAYWSMLIGLNFTNSCNLVCEQSDTVEKLAINIGERGQIEFMKIIKYIRIFDFKLYSYTNSVLYTILFPNIVIYGLETKFEEKGEFENNEMNEDKLIRETLKVQFNFMIKVVNFLLNRCDLLKTNEEKDIISNLNKIIGIYNQVEIYRLYENYYFNSKSLFRIKLVKYFSFLNTQFDWLDSIFYQEFVCNCFGNKKESNSLIKIIPNSSEILIKDIFYQLFPNLLVSVNLLVDYVSIYHLLTNRCTKSKKREILRNNYLDSFILYLEIEKTEFNGTPGNKMVNFILEQFIIQIEKILNLNHKFSKIQLIELVKLIRITSILFFKINVINEQSFDKYFDYICYFQSKFLNIGKVDLEDRFVSSNSLDNGFFFDYLNQRNEFYFYENKKSLENSLYLFCLKTFFELIKNICFSEMKEFFKKNHSRLLELIKLRDDKNFMYQKMLMISKLLIPKKNGNNQSILTTTLGRSFGIFFIPALCSNYINKNHLNSARCDENELKEDIIQNILNTFFISAVNSNMINYDHLYCIIDCIITVFIYYVSKFLTCSFRLINQILYRFTQQFYSSISTNVKNVGIKDFSEKLLGFGLYCISLLEELGTNYEITQNETQSTDSKGSTLSIIEFCRGLQFHFSHFFINNKDPDTFIKDTEIFNRWNYIKNTVKFKIPSYLYKKSSSIPEKVDVLHFKWNIPKSNKTRILDINQKQRNSNHISGKTNVSILEVNKNDNFEIENLHCMNIDTSNFIELRNLNCSENSLKVI